MIFGSVCSGIEAASVAWAPLGWRAAWFAEVDKAPCKLLDEMYPHVPNVGDMCALPDLIRAGVSAPDVLVGGTPCQAFSVAGLRGSLGDSRGQLTLKFIEVANAIDEQRETPCIIVWENVPGVLSAKDNAFGCFLGGLAGEPQELHAPGGRWPDAGCVFGPQRAIAWRVLDAQYFGLAQRRKRVFVVASAREGFDPTKVLFEFDGVRRDSPPSRETTEVVAATIDAGAGRRRGRGMNANQLVPAELAGALMARMGRGFNGQEAEENQLIVVHGTQDPCVSDSTSFALGRNNGAENAVFAVRTAQTSSNGWGVNPHTAYTLDGANGQAVAFATRDVARTITSNYGKQCDNSDTSLGPNVAISLNRVRRLTPVECERLMGFPDNYTACLGADSPRYKALGNSMAVPVMRWIGERIQNEVTPRPPQ